MTLVRATHGRGKPTAFARQHGISKSLVARTRTGTFPVGIKVSQALGYWVKHDFSSGLSGYGRLTFWEETK